MPKMHSKTFTSEFLVGVNCFREARAVLNVLKNEHFSREWAQIVVSTFPEELVSPLFVSRNATDFASLTPSELNTVNSEKYLVS